ncbi:uncharacterized protein LOC114523225 [Dendronephthya gigantea]|uniref:uncharacterized protein LOC114523225 n=1 Tax=Dendronephthya gigantea TaxID=151771 RepID=UPI00106D81CA|nr:uncharacterized protein LOC114523225 [Dendronephthya gigantea]
MGETSLCLLFTGWLTLIHLYLIQVVLLIVFLGKHEHSEYGVFFLGYLPTVFLTGSFISRNGPLKYADEDKEIRYVWFIWGLYIVPFVVTVATIFATVAKDLTEENHNALIGTLCITPGLLVLLPQLTISPFFRKPVLSLSVFGALDIFDGIQMLQIFLMQKEGNFDLDVHLERSIVVFACFCFLLTPLSLLRNEFKPNGDVEERKSLSIIVGLFEIFAINLPCLVLRAVVWNKYQAAIFLTKNVIALIVGAVHFLVLIGMCKCGE